VDALILQVFVSLMLVLGSVILFVFTTRQRDFDHADRLALLPVEDDGAAISLDARADAPSLDARADAPSLDARADAPSLDARADARFSTEGKDT
jgi:hypothetical protein